MSIATALPLELLAHTFSHLIEELNRDIFPLCSCSLVCRAWRHVAQRVLFRNSSLRLNRLPWTDPDRMKDISVVAPLFHRARIWSSSFTSTLEGDANSRLRFKPALSFMIKAAPLEDVAWDRVVALCPHITEVDICQTSFSHLAALRDVLRAFPALEHLTFHTLKVHHADDLPVWAGLRLLTLQSGLGTDHAINSALLTWLASAERPRLEGVYDLELCESVYDALRDVLVTCERSMRTLEVKIVSDGEQQFTGTRIIQPHLPEFAPRLSSWLPATSLLEELDFTADYMSLHAIIDEITLSRLKVLRITCQDFYIDFDDAVHHEDVLVRMHLPVLKEVVLYIEAEFDVSEAELLMPFASAARRGTLTYEIDPDPRNNAMHAALFPDEGSSPDEASSDEE
jgi:hypothetical protein